MHIYIYIYIYNYIMRVAHVGPSGGKFIELMTCCLVCVCVCVACRSVINMNNNL